MIYLKKFKNQTEGIGYMADTPFTSVVNGINNKVLYIPQSVGDKVEIIDDGNGFITYEIPAPVFNVPDDEIWYFTTDGEVINYGNPGGYGATIVSNTYEDGGGIIKFNGPVTTCQYGALNNVANLKEVYFPNTVTRMSSGLNHCVNLTTIQLSNTLAYLGESAIDGNTSLKSLVIPDSVTTLWNSAVSNCTSLTSVTISNSVTAITGSALSKNTALESIEIPSSVTSLQYSALSDCSSLSSVTLHDSITTFDDTVFVGVSATGNLYLDSEALLSNENVVNVFNGWSLYVNGVFVKVITRPYKLDYFSFGTGTYTDNSVMSVMHVDGWDNFLALCAKYNVTKFAAPDTMEEIFTDNYYDIEALDINNAMSSTFVALINAEFKDTFCFYHYEEESGGGDLSPMYADGNTSASTRECPNVVLNAKQFFTEDGVCLANIELTADEYNTWKE